MEQKITLEGQMTAITLSNLGEIDNFDFNPNDLNEEADIASIMEEVNTYAESGEIDTLGDVVKLELMSPEDIEYFGIEKEDGSTQALTMENLSLQNTSADTIKDILENANDGDLIYLRKEVGKASIIMALECESKSDAITVSYYDCSGELNQYDLLNESYYDAVCDTIAPLSMTTNTGNASVEHFIFEPQIVYGELFRVVTAEGIKNLERVPLPGYYFQNQLEDSAL